MSCNPPALAPIRYEVLPFGSAEQQAAQLAEPVPITITCSPKHGPDQTVDCGARIRALGHTVTVHLAARMIRSRKHLDALLARMDAAGIGDVFVVGGDAAETSGPYATGLSLLRELRGHDLAPAVVGIPAYPEGHPLIAPEVLHADLVAKARLADYMATQMCFDPGRILACLERARFDGVNVPVYVGIPGAVDRRRLLEISVRVGVGTSISYLRKQHGVRHLFGSGRAAATRLHDAIAPEIGGPLGVAGLHVFTFNRLVETVRLGLESSQEPPAPLHLLADRGSASTT